MSPGVPGRLGGRWRAPVRPRRRGRGQSLVELALATPILLVLALGVSDGGRAFYYREAVTNAARQAIRVAVSSAQQASGDSACKNSGGTETAHVPWQAGDGADLVTIASTAAYESGGSGGSSQVAGATITVTWHCSGGKAITNADAISAGVTDPLNSRSDAVTVTVRYQFTLITPFADRLFPNKTIGSTVIGRAEY